MSRLARSCADWYQLLELCALLTASIVYPTVVLPAHGPHPSLLTIASGEQYVGRVSDGRLMLLIVACATRGGESDAQSLDMSLPPHVTVGAASTRLSTSRICSGSAGRLM